MEFNIWDEISNLHREDKKELYNSLEKELGFIPTSRELSPDEIEFQKACTMLKKNRNMIPKEDEEMIISLAKKYTLFYV